MTVWFEIAELAGELRSAWLDGIAPAELDQALEELRSVGRRSIYQLGQLGRDVQAVASKDSMGEFFLHRRDEPNGTDTTPLKQGQRS
jgi:hypothetical protein